MKKPYDSLKITENRCDLGRSRSGLGATLLFAATGLEPGTLPTDRLRVKFEKALVGTVWERQAPPSASKLRENASKTYGKPMESHRNP